VTGDLLAGIYQFDTEGDTFAVLCDGSRIVIISASMTCADIAESITQVEII
jgi:hypothetical protein